MAPLPGYRGRCRRKPHFGAFVTSGWQTVHGLGIGRGGNQNRLEGSIPAELEGLPALGALFLGENRLTGCVPRSLRRLARSDLAALGLESCALPATELGYGAYDGTGAVAAAGRYAFLTEGEDGEMTAVTTYEGLRDGTATSLLIHQSDAAGASRAEVYDVLEAGDLVEWKQANDCFVRYVVTEVTPAPAGTVLGQRGELGDAGDRGPPGAGGLQPGRGGP